MCLLRLMIAVALQEVWCAYNFLWSFCDTVLVTMQLHETREGLSHVFMTLISQGCQFHSHQQHGTVACPVARAQGHTLSSYR